MQKFIDEAFIEIISGDGGQGSVSFRREKYVPRGGPDGGDGGSGGDILFVVKNNLKTLSHLRMKSHYKAGNGEPGAKRLKHGKDGNSVIIPVPPGTILKEKESGKLLKDLVSENEQWLALEGGKGGKGNWHFRSSTNQAPRYAQPGLPGKSMNLFVELDIIADIGLVGFPNAGKSTLLSVITKANPKIADYPFTTKIPNLGVYRRENTDITIADIPGIIEGASHGAGLGLRFLKHISRTSVIALIIDLSDENRIRQYDILMQELSAYSSDLLSKKMCVIGTKMDLPGAEEAFAALGNHVGKIPLLGVSSFTHQGLQKMLDLFLETASK